MSRLRPGEPEWVVRVGETAGRRPYTRYPLMAAIAATHATAPAQLPHAT
jgi:hypothetical protein